MKNAFIKSTIILTLGTIITKLLGFVIRIIFTRLIKDGISYYSIIIPTLSLLSAITSLSLPYAISVIVARKKYSGKDLMINILPIALIIDTIIITILFLTAKPLTSTLLKCEEAYLPLISYSIVIPFQTISGLIKGYYFGKQNMLPSSISNVIEQLVRLILVITIVPFLLEKSVIYAISGFIIISSISEIVQILIYLFYLPNKINLKNISLNKNIINDVMSLAIPHTSGRIIGNICYFFEPIILTNILLFIGYSSNYITHEYAIYNSYVIPILTIPTFFTTTLNTTLIPEISKYHNNKKMIIKRLKQTLLISLLIGVFYSSIIYFKGNTILSLIYKTNEGFDYIKFLSYPFIVFYLEGPLISTLQGLNKSLTCMKITLTSCIFKIIILSISSFFSIGIYSLLVSEIIHILITILLSTKNINLALKSI